MLLCVSHPRIRKRCTRSLAQLQTVTHPKLHVAVTLALWRGARADDPGSRLRSLAHELAITVLQPLQSPCMCGALDMAPLPSHDMLDHDGKAAACGVPGYVWVCRRMSGRRCPSVLTTGGRKDRDVDLRVLAEQTLPPYSQCAVECCLHEQLQAVKHCRAAACVISCTLQSICVRLWSCAPARRDSSVHSCG